VESSVPALSDLQNKVSPGTLGHVAELYVIQKLLLLGWEVYHSISPNCPADVVVRRGERCSFADIKFVRQWPPSANVYKRLRSEECDLVFMVTDWWEIKILFCDGEIVKLEDWDAA
jgi:hypothetical protein